MLRREVNDLLDKEIKMWFQRLYGQSMVIEIQSFFI